MTNMSYCRFQNTIADLRDCQDALDEGVLDDKGFSPDERKAALRLIRICKEIADAFDGMVPDAD